MQQGDVLLYQTDDDGEINVENGLIEMSGGLQTAAYLSLFGGNESDDGLTKTQTWWGNIDEDQSDRLYRSETQNLLRSIPLTSGNLIRIQDAAKRDLDWFVSSGVASSVSVVASIPGLNKVKINININAIGEKSEFEFIENWEARS